MYIVSRALKVFFLNLLFHKTSQDDFQVWCLKGIGLGFTGLEPVIRHEQNLGCTVHGNF